MSKFVSFSNELHSWTEPRYHCLDHWVMPGKPEAAEAWTGWTGVMSRAQLRPVQLSSTGATGSNI